MRLIYTLFIRLYSFGIFIASFFNEKAKLLHSGRKQTFQIIKDKCAGKEIIWFHAASLGEYEQGKPLIQKLRHLHPECSFLVSFFSPSGYEIKKNDTDIDIAVYLPSDTPQKAQRFIEIVNPKAAFFIKYEYWYNYMKALTDKQIPFYYVSAIYRPSQYFFKPIGRWFARQLSNCTHFFVQNEISRQLLQSIGIENATVTGDTRFDRVHTIAQNNETLPFVEEFKGTSKLLVAGSTWQPDEQILWDVYPQIKRQGYKMIIAPHVIGEEHIQDICELFSAENTILYTEIQGQNLAEYDILIIDAIGFLSKVYKYADIAHIGGAFATGLHNTLEAAVFGIPLFFGPQYAKFQEAVELVARQGAFSVEDSAQMKAILQRFEIQPTLYETTCNICTKYVQENLGSCDKILQVISTLS